ncbi:MAG TPA: ATP-binding protein [Thermotogota bacterium]|nr:ATP-binding protein [Thermotogota bacterium]
MKEFETIEKLLNAKEGEQYQFKEWKIKDDFKESVKICCALANCGGGKLVLGISDKRPRKVVGSRAFPQPERTRKDLIDKLHVMVDFQLYKYEGERVLVFDVASRPAGLPVQAEGVAWWYEGDSLITMPPDVLRDIYEETGHDFSSDICLGAKVADLDEAAIEAFRSNWVEKSGNKQLKNLSIDQLLCDVGAITSEGVTYAALVLFGTRDILRKHLAQAEIVFEYRSSEASGPAAQREDFTIGFFACFNRVWELINLRNDKQHYQEGLFVFDIPTFNERVVREALLNAVSHRNYQLAGSVFVRQYRDRLVIESPGGFPAGVTPENILYRQSPRNRRIAEILALCGLVERSGQGMDLMYELSVRESKELPSFFGSDGYQVKLTLNGLILDKRLLLFLKKIGEERQELLSTADFLVIDALFHEKPLTEYLRERLKRLVEMRIIEHTGRGKYVLVRGLYEATGKSGVHTRLTGLDRETNKELLIKHICASGSKGAPLKELQQVLPNHSHNQLQVLMRELRKEGRIYCEGKTNAARWFLTDL